MTTSAPAAPKAPAKQASIAASASAVVSAIDDALAGGEAVGLHHDRQLLRAMR